MTFPSLLFTILHPSPSDSLSVFPHVSSVARFYALLAGIVQVSLHALSAHSNQLLNLRFLKFLVLNCTSGEPVVDGRCLLIMDAYMPGILKFDDMIYYLSIDQCCEIAACCDARPL